MEYYNKEKEYFEDLRIKREIRILKSYIPKVIEKEVLIFEDKIKLYIDLSSDYLKNNLANDNYFKLISEYGNEYDFKEKMKAQSISAYKDYKGKLTETCFLTGIMIGFSAECEDYFYGLNIPYKVVAEIPLLRAYLKNNVYNNIN